VILHVRYTAREGGDDLRALARDAVNTRISRATTSPLWRMLSLRHEYPGEWHRAAAAGGDVGPLDLTNRMPALFAGRQITIGSARRYFAVSDEAITPVAIQTGGRRLVLRTTSAKISIGTAGQGLALTDPLPNDLLVLVPYTVGD
jgi:hypothetical protein